MNLLSFRRFRPPTRSTRLIVAAALVVGTTGTPAGQSVEDRRAALVQTLQAGEEAIRVGNAKLALETFQGAIKDAEALAETPLVARALAGLGWGQWATGDYESAIRTRTRAVTLFQQLGDASGEAFVLRGLGETLYGLGRYDEALAQYRLGLAASERADNARERGLILSNMGSALRNLGRLDESLEVLVRAVAVLRPLKAPSDLALPLTFLGIVSRARGEFDRAIDYYTEALTAVRAENNRRQESQILGNMGNVYGDLGRYDRAIELHRQALTIAGEIGYTAQVGFAQQNIASILNEAGRPADALPYFEAALTTWRTVNRRVEIGNTLRNLSVLRLWSEQNVEGARDAANEALAIAREAKEIELEGYALMSLGDADYRVADYRSALARYDEALRVVKEPRNPDIEYKALAGRGAALVRLGRLDEAIAALQASARIVNDLRGHVSSDQSKIAFLDTRQAVFLDLASALVDAGRVDEALEAAEAVRARALADLMNDRDLRVTSDKRDTLAVLRQAIAKSAPEDEVTAALVKLRSQSHELASLVAAESPRAAEARAVAARLDGATIVEYLVREESALAFVIRPDGIRVQRLAITAGKLNGLVRDALRQLASPSPQDLRQADRVAPVLKEIHRSIVAPLAKWLPEDPRTPVVIVPHGALTLLPFAPLLDEAGVPLVERHTLSYAPALSVFRYTETRRAGPGQRRSALIVADPVPPKGADLERLPASVQEGRAVQRRLGGDALLLTGAGATEAAVKRTAGSRQVLHLATHGLVSEQRPLASSLLLGEGEGEDGYLRADEIFGLTLNADLVVLSGCSTGLGRLSGEGLLGLTRSFFFAGSASLVVSHWDISDVATVGLMDRFYSGLARGMSKAAALRAAQIETRRRYPHPALWAAFVLLGEPG